MQVRSGVLQFATPLANRRNDVYVFAGSRGALLFDTGVDGAAHGSIRPGLEEAGIAPDSITQVVVSHCDVDHFGGLASAREEFAEASYLAHANDAGMIQDFALYLQGRGRSMLAGYGLDEPADDLVWLREVTREAPIDRLVAGGETIDLGDRELRLLHVPGHTRGHLGIHDPANSVVAISDAILGSAVPSAAGDPLFPPTYRHVPEYLATIEQVRRLRPDLLLTAHYGSYEGRAVTEFLDESAEFCHDLGRRVYAAVEEAGQPLTLVELLEGLLPQVGTWPREGRLNALAYPVAGHLEHDAAAGRIRLDASGPMARFGVSR